MLSKPFSAAVLCRGPHHCLYLLSFLPALQLGPEYRDEWAPGLRRYQQGPPLATESEKEGKRESNETGEFSKHGHMQIPSSICYIGVQCSEQAVPLTNFQAATAQMLIIP